MQMRFTLSIAALSIAWGGFVLAQSQEDFISPLIGSFKAGVLCAQETGVVRAAPDTVSGTTHVVDAPPPYVSNGRIVPAVIGIGFGVTAGLLADEAAAGVTVTVEHPPFPGTGATRQSFDTIIGTRTEPGITFYQFDYGYELVPGEWVMTAETSGVTLYEVRFTVVPPQALPGLAGVCGYQDLIG